MSASQSETNELPRYNRHKTYLENYAAAPDPMFIEIPEFHGDWEFCGLPVDSPLGIAAGPLLNGKWCLYYASLGFDVLTYKTVRSAERDCYPLPNLVPVDCGDLAGNESELPARDQMNKSWAVSFGMPSQDPEIWRADIRRTRDALPAGKILSVSVVGTMEGGWTIQDLANDYALCAQWATASGADTIEVNFSCPNVSTLDGQLCQTPSDAALVAATVREAIGSTPLIVKIGHVEPARISALVEALGSTINAFAMTNSVAATVVNQTGDVLFNGQKRGICGDGCRQVSLAQIKRFRKSIAAAKLSTEIIGVGGAFTANHVWQYLSAGASAVHMATSAMLDPMAGARIKTDQI